MAQFSGHSLTGGDKEIFSYRDALLTPVRVRTADSRSVSADDFPALPCTLAGPIDFLSPGSPQSPARNSPIHSGRVWQQFQEHALTCKEKTDVKFDRKLCSETMNYCQRILHSVSKHQLFPVH